MIENGAEVTKEPEITKELVKPELVKPEIDEDREKEPEVLVQIFIVIFFKNFCGEFQNDDY